MAIDFKYDDPVASPAPKKAEAASGFSYEEPDPTRSALQRGLDAYKAMSLKGVGGSIAVAAKKAQGYTDEQVNQAYDAALKEIEDRQAADPSWRPDETFLQAAASGRWVPGVIGDILGSPEYLVNAGGKGVQAIARSGVAAGGIDLANQAIHKIEGVTDSIDPTEILNTVAATAGLQAAGHGLGKLWRHFVPEKAPEANVAAAAPDITPEQLAAVDAISKTATAEELRALGVANADEVVAAREKGANVTQSVAGEAPTAAAAPEAPTEAPPIVVTAPHKPEAFVHARDLGDGSHVYNYSAPDGREIPVRMAIDDGVATVDVDKFNDAAKNTLGPVETRNAIYDMVNQFPEITEVGGFRRTGAGAGREQTIPITDKLREKAAEYAKTKPQENWPTYEELNSQILELNKEYYSLNDRLKQEHEDGDVNATYTMRERDAIAAKIEPLRSKFYSYAKQEALTGKKILNETKPGDLTVIRPLALHPDAHEFRYVSPDGKEVVGNYYYDGGDTIEGFDISSSTGPNSIGPAAIKEIVRRLKAKHPNAVTLSADRVSGARVPAGTTGPIELPTGNTKIQAGQGVDLNGDVSYKPAPEVPDAEMPKYAKSINLEKLDTAKDVDEYILEQSKAIPRDYQSHKETEDLAAILGQDTAALLKKNPELSELPQYAVALHNTLVEASNNVVAIAKRVKAGENSDEALDELFKAVLVQRHIQERATKVSGTAGRTLEAHKIIKSGGASYAKALAELPQSKINTREGLEGLAGVLADAPDAAAISKIIADTQKKTLWDKIIGFRYNMMLFGPTTHTANNLGIFSAVTHDLLNHSLASVTGQVTRSADRVAAREVAARVEGMMAGLFSGAAWRNSRKALNEGDILTPTGKSEHTVQNEGNIGDLVALGSRALNAEDEFWRTIIHSGSNYALAYRTALKEGRKGEAFKARVQGLINSPTPELVAASDEYAHRMLLRDTPTAPTAAFMRGRVIKPTDHYSMKGLKGVSQIVFPFVRVLDRATMYSIRHSPLSFLDRVTQADFKAGGARAEIAKARIATGTALATWAALKAYNGELTGPGPEDFEANQKWQAAGHRPNSIVVNGQYRDISNLLPLSIPLTTIASAVEDAKTGKFSEKSYQDKIETLVGDVIAGLGTNTWTSSVADLGKMVTGSQGQKDAARKGYVANVASSFVPAFLRQFNQADPMGLGDPSVRTTSGDGSLGQRVLGRVASAVPGVSEDLPQKYNVYGKPVMREGVYGPGFLSNIKVSDLDPDPAVREMDRLMAANDYKGGVTPVESSLQVPDYAGGGPNRKLTAAEVSEYQHRAGAYITDYVREQMKTPEWKRMSDAERLADIEDTTAKAKAQARDELFWNPEPQFSYEDSPAPANTFSAAAAQDLQGKFGVRITDDTVRSRKTQAKYYATTKGAAPPGKSDHEDDRAVDFAPVRGLTPKAVQTYMESQGYQGVKIITKRHGTGPHWHVQWESAPVEGFSYD